VQEQVQDLLASLLRMQDVNVVTEMRFVTVSDETFKKLGIDAQQNGTTRRSTSSMTRRCPCCSKRSRPTLGRRHAGAEIDLLQRAESDRLVHGPPYVHDRTARGQGSDGHTLLVPQTTAVNAGFQATVQPAASADRTQVTMSLGITISRLDTSRAAAVPCSGVFWLPTPTSAGQPATLTPYAYRSPA